MHNETEIDYVSLTPRRSMISRSSSLNCYASDCRPLSLNFAPNPMQCTESNLFSRLEYTCLNLELSSHGCMLFAVLTDAACLRNVYKLELDLRW